MTSTRYAIVRTASYNGSFRNAVDGVQEPTREGHTYFVRGIGTSRARSTWGQREVLIEHVVDGDAPTRKPLTWATREAAERGLTRVASDHITYEIVEVDVVADLSAYDVSNDARANAIARETPGAWTAIVGYRRLVLARRTSVDA